MKVRYLTRPERSKELFDWFDHRTLKVEFFRDSRSESDRFPEAQAAGPAVAQARITSTHQIALFCHPDRGGDNELMTTVNMLLDRFDEQEGTAEQLVNSRQAGGVA